MNPSDPVTYLVLTVLAGIVLVGFYYFLREIIADAIALNEKRRQQREGRWEDPHERKHK